MSIGLLGCPARRRELAGPKIALPQSFLVSDKRRLFTSMTTQNPDSLITVKNSLIAQSNSLINAENFPVRIPREFPRKSLWQLVYFLLFPGFARPDDENSLYFPT